MLLRCSKSLGVWKQAFGLGSDTTQSTVRAQELAGYYLPSGWRPSGEVRMGIRLRVVQGKDDCVGWLKCFSRILLLSFPVFKMAGSGIPGLLSGLVPALGRGAILESRDRVPRRAPAWSLLLPLPVSLPLSVCVTIIKKKNLKKYCAKPSIPECFKFSNEMYPFGYLDTITQSFL